jgi:SNF2 family DNA or RNA helicase
MHRSVGVAYGPAPKRRKIINGEYEFIITNYDGVNVVYEEIKNGKFDLIVIDEANAYKSTSTQRWKLMAKLLQPHTKLWMLTGTPASQSPVEQLVLHCSSRLNYLVVKSRCAVFARHSFELPANTPL